MIIVGAKGLAREVLEIFVQKNEMDNIFFFDNISTDLPAKLYGRFPILRNMDEVKAAFKTSGDASFTLGLGNPLTRFKMNKLFTEHGGIPFSAISPRADIGHFENTLSGCCTVLTGAVITNHVQLGQGCLVNPNCTISHDCVIGDFVEISPGVSVTGYCVIGNFCQLGTNSVILPKVQLGENVIVGAGAVVTKNVPSNTLVVGVPAVTKRKLEPLRP